MRTLKGLFYFIFIFFTFFQFIYCDNFMNDFKIACALRIEFLDEINERTILQYSPKSEEQFCLEISSINSFVLHFYLMTIYMVVYLSIMKWVT